MTALFTGILLIDVFLVLGLIVLALALLGIPVWMLASKLRWRIKDAADMAIAAGRIAAAKATPKHRNNKEVTR